jgi:syringomycin synthetase protein SyrE
MTTIGFLSQLRSKGIRVWVDGARLRYSAPSGALSPELFASLSERREEILSFLRRTGPAETSIGQPIRKTARDGNPPLSFAQERLWFLSQLDPLMSAYNAPIMVRLTGALNIAAMQETLNEIARRHETLRTTFVDFDGRPVQRISESTSITLQMVDLTKLPENIRRQSVGPITVEAAKRPFDLAAGPLARATLVRVSEQEHIALFTTHHIVSDGWSMGVLVEELTSLYAVFHAGTPSPLPEIEIQYSDYVRWQRDWLQSDGFKAQMDYWKKRLAPLPPRIALPVDKPRPEIQSFRGAQHQFVISPELRSRLEALGRQEEATLFMTGLAAFQSLLHFYSGQQVIATGSTIAGRNRRELENLIGFFANVLIFSMDLSGDPTFRNLLRQARRETIEAYARQDVPFEKLVEDLQPERHPGYPPLIHVGFSLQNTPVLKLQLPGLKIDHLQLPNETSKFDLTLLIWETEEGLVCAFEYNTDLFESTTITRLAEDYQTLLERAAASPDQRLSEILSDRKHHLGARPGSAAGGQAEELARWSNLTRNQLLMWMGQSLLPETAAYNNAFAIHLEHDIDFHHWRKAFLALQRSSDALRTVIVQETGVPQQRVLDHPICDPDYLDFSETPEPMEQASEWMARRTETLFDLERGMVDCALLKITRNHFIWYYKVHHLIIDYLSLVIAARRMSDFYERSLQGRELTAEDFSRFGDFVEFERKHRASPEYKVSESYWKRKLSARIDHLSFYSRLPKNAGMSGRRLYSTMEPRLADRLRAVAQREDVWIKNLNVTMFNLLAASLLTYLYRVSGQSTLSIGIPFHNRSASRFKDTLGLFMEVLPMRLTIEGSDSFLSLARKASAEAADTLKHNMCAIGNPSQSKSYEIFFNYNVAPEMSFLGKRAPYQWLSSNTAMDSLSVHLFDHGPSNEIKLMFDFDCGIFDQEDQRRAIDHFMRVVEAMIEDVNQPIAQVNILSPIEEGFVWESAGRTELPFPNDITIVDLFERRADEAPDRIAVIYGQESLSYGELNAAANRLAWSLRRVGVRPESRVGICLSRSIQMVIAALGVLKAGGAYVPIDPNYPADRRAYMLRDSGVTVLVTREEDGGEESEQNARIVRLDIERLRRFTESGSNPEPYATAANLAYVIYTSGSTGRAKAAQVAHENLVNAYFAWELAYNLTGREDRHLQTVSFSFDVFSGDLIRALCSGAKLILTPWEWLLDAEQLYRLIVEQKITCAEFVPAVARNLAVFLEQSGKKLDSLRLMIVGSDSWHVNEYKAWQSLCGPDARVINSYGVAEASIDSSYFENLSMPFMKDSGNQPVPIGHPFANTRIHILDSHLNLLPPGVAGELYIGGAGVARGYLNRPGLTADRFVPDPFNKNQGTRLYRTGDLARHLNAGQIELLGRTDNQIKIRGFRIEAGEIETRLKDHPQVTEAVVIAAGQKSLEQTLVAYVVTSGQRPALEAELRSFLKQSLIDHMIPSVFVMLESLPLTPNGKVDRSALPAPTTLKRDRNTVYTPPKTELERTLVEIWRQALSVEDVSVEDNFFDLGGHSLLLVQIHRKLRETFGEKVTIVDLFKYTTISLLADFLSQSDQETAVSERQDREAKLREAKGRLQRQLELKRRATKG